MRVCNEHAAVGLARLDGLADVPSSGDLPRITLPAPREANLHLRLSIKTKLVRAHACNDLNVRLGDRCRARGKGSLSEISDTSSPERRWNFSRSASVTQPPPCLVFPAHAVVFQPRIRLTAATARPLHVPVSVRQLDAELRRPEVVAKMAAGGCESDGPQAHPGELGRDDQGSDAPQPTSVSD